MRRDGWRASGFPLATNPPTTHPPGLGGIDLGSFGNLVGYRIVLRKEVIQPQVPLRLPCYDFVPLTGHTFDASPRLPGWASGFGCSRLR